MQHWEDYAMHEWTSCMMEDTKQPGLASLLEDVPQAEPQSFKKSFKRRLSVYLTMRMSKYQLHRPPIYLFQGSHLRICDITTSSALLGQY